MNTDIQQHFQNIQKIIRQGKAGALQAATAFSISSYWHVGGYISDRLTENTYGKNIVNQLAAWLKQQDPSLKGHDWRSLYRMREFFGRWQHMDWTFIYPSQSLEYQSLEMPELFSEILGLPTPKSIPMPILLTKVSWTHHIEILRGTNSQEEMLFYLVLSVR